MAQAKGTMRSKKQPTPATWDAYLMGVGKAVGGVGKRRVEEVEEGGGGCRGVEEGGGGCRRV